MTTPLAWFGLSDDADERALKRAYAQRLKTTRPDADPAGFQQLHERYQSALQWLQQQAKATPPEDVAAEPAPAAAPHDNDVAQVDIAAAQAREAAAPRPLPSTTQFDLDVFLADYFDVALHEDAPRVQAWLEGREELWSLHLKHQVGYALLQRWFRDPPAIRMSTTDATLAFFGLDHALIGVDPLHMQQLREAMQERSALVQRHPPAVQPWGGNRRRLDMPAFFAWYSERAASDQHEALAATLYVQPALLSLASREQAAVPLFERLLQGRPPLPQDCASLLAQTFGFAGLAQQRNVPLGELIAHLHMRWLMQPAQKGKLALQVKQPSERIGDPIRATRQLRMLQRPFRWWWITLAALVPRLLYSLGLFAWRISGGAPARLDEFFDARLTRFCIATADRTRIAWPRVFVGGVRCGAIVLLSLITQFVVLNAAVLPETDTWLPLEVGIGATACWLYYLGYTALRLWQQQPEEPVQPLPLLRMGLIPLMVMVGGVLAFAFDQLVPAQFLLLTAALMSFQRYQLRNPERKAMINNGVAIVYLVGIAAWIVLRFPVVSSGIALFFWALDLTVQRKRLRFRRPQPQAVPAA